MRCPNCNTEIADHLTVCWFCGSNLITLENFLNKKNKIIVIIGVFGALSIYLSQIPTNNDGKILLQIGSGISLLIMTALASLLITDCYSFTKNFPKDTEYYGSGYSKWIKQTMELVYLWIFLIGFFVIVISVLCYMLFFSNINEIVIKVVYGIILIIVFVPFIILPSDHIVKQKKLKSQILTTLLLGVLMISGLVLLLTNLMNSYSLEFFLGFLLAGMSLIGYWNALYVTFDTANETE